MLSYRSGFRSGSKRSEVRKVSSAGSHASVKRLEIGDRHVFDLFSFLQVPTRSFSVVNKEIGRLLRRRSIFLKNLQNSFESPGCTALCWHHMPKRFCKVRRTPVIRCRRTLSDAAAKKPTFRRRKTQTVACRAARLRRAHRGRFRPKGAWSWSSRSLQKRSPYRRFPPRS